MKMFEQIWLDQNVIPFATLALYFSLLKLFQLLITNFDFNSFLIIKSTATLGRDGAQFLNINQNFDCPEFRKKILLWLRRKLKM